MTFHSLLASKRCLSHSKASVEDDAATANPAEMPRAKKRTRTEGGGADANPAEMPRAKKRKRAELSREEVRSNATAALQARPWSKSALNRQRVEVLRVICQQLGILTQENKTKPDLIEALLARVISLALTDVALTAPQEAKKVRFEEPEPAEWNAGR